MIAVEKIVEKLNSMVRYKSNFWITFSGEITDLEPSGKLFMEIRANFPNINHPGRTTPISVRRSISISTLEEKCFDNREVDILLKKWVRESIMVMEEHELDEWLFWGTKQIRDPHPGIDAEEKILAIIRSFHASRINLVLHERACII